MDFTYTDDQRMLDDTLRRYLADRYPIEARNAAAHGPVGHDPAHWAALAELGVTGALFTAEAGGFGGTGFDLALLFEALGHALVVEPFLPTLMAGTALAAAGRGDLVERMIAGQTLVAFAAATALDDAPDDAGLAATEDGDGWRLDGTQPLVAFAEAADLFVVAAGTGLFLVPRDTAGVSVDGHGLVDGGRAGTVRFAGVRVPADARVGDADPLIEQAAAAGLLALSAEALGLMEWLKAATADYLRTRIQFGQPIGRFQALQFRMADLLLAIEQARSAVINAAAAFETPGPARDIALAAAKYTIGEVGRRVAEEAIQLHGGIGMTWELPLSHYAKRLVMIDHQLGDADRHLTRYIAIQQASGASAVRV